MTLVRDTLSLKSLSLTKKTKPLPIKRSPTQHLASTATLEGLHTRDVGACTAGEHVGESLESATTHSCGQRRGAAHAAALRASKARPTRRLVGLRFASRVTHGFIDRKDDTRRLRGSADGVNFRRFRLPDILRKGIADSLVVDVNTEPFPILWV